MNTRIVHTQMHLQDDWFNTLSIGYRYLFIYLFTNSHIGQTGAYKLSERIILLETGASKEDWIGAKIEFEKSGKIKFFDGDWIFVVNAQKYSNYSGGKNEVAYKREFSTLPEPVRDTISIHYQYSIDTTINQKSEIINNKSEIGNQKSEIRNRGYEGFTNIGKLLKEDKNGKI